MEPNIFDYATGELSQDAMICWCLSFYNFKKHKLYQFACDLLQAFTGAAPQNYGDTITINRQSCKTDIVISVMPSGKTIIIEDKIYTSEHNQLKKYRQEIADKLNKNPAEICVVYLKTGFYYDKDKLLEYNKAADKYIHGDELLKIISKYKNINTLLDMYAEHLENLIKWYQLHGDFTSTSDKSFWNWNIAKEYIAQYKFMRAVFPQELWNKADEKLLYMVKQGSSYGRPWANVRISENPRFFWRLDTDKNGPYFSLRLYQENHDKTKYIKYLEIIKQIVADNNFYFIKEEAFNFHSKQNYKEATVLHLHIAGILQNWQTKKDDFIADIKQVTKLLQEKIEL